MVQICRINLGFDYYPLSHPLQQRFHSNTPYAVNHYHHWLPDVGLAIDGMIHNYWQKISQRAITNVISCLQPISPVLHCIPYTIHGHLSYPQLVMVAMRPSLSDCLSVLPLQTQRVLLCAVLVYLKQQWQPSQQKQRMYMAMKRYMVALFAYQVL